MTYADEHQEHEHQEHDEPPQHLHGPRIATPLHHDPPAPIEHEHQDDEPLR